MNSSHLHSLKNDVLSSHRHFQRKKRGVLRKDDVRGVPEKREENRMQQRAKTNRSVLLARYTFHKDRHSIPANNKKTGRFHLLGDRRRCTSYSLLCPWFMTFDPCDPSSFL